MIDQLWSYILNIIEEYNINGESEVYFPDSPNKIKIKRMVLLEEQKVITLYKIKMIQ